MNINMIVKLHYCGYKDISFYFLRINEVLNMYAYQEKVIENIDDAIYKIEEMTEEHYRIHMGGTDTPMNSKIKTFQYLLK